MRTRSESPTHQWQSGHCRTCFVSATSTRLIIAKMTYTLKAMSPLPIRVEALVLRAAIQIVTWTAFACVELTEDLALRPGVCSSPRINGDSMKGAIAHLSAIPIRSASVTIFSAGNTTNRSSGDLLAYSKSTAIALKDPIG